MVIVGAAIGWILDAMLLICILAAVRRLTKKSRKG